MVYAYVVYGMWYMVCGIWYVVYGMWYVVYGIWYEVLFTQRTVDHHYKTKYREYHQRNG